MTSLSPAVVADPILSALWATEEAMLVFTPPQAATAFLTSAALSHGGEPTRACEPAPTMAERAASAATAPLAAEERAVQRHYQALLERIREEVVCARRTGERVERDAGVTTSSPGGDPTWLSRVVVDVEELYECASDAGCGRSGAQLFLERACTRWSSLCPRSRTANPTTNVPSVLLIVVLQEVDFAYLWPSDGHTSGRHVPLRCPVLHGGQQVFGAESTPIVQRGYPPMGSPLTTPQHEAQKGNPSLLVAVTTSGFLIHSLFFRSWCRPADFPFHIPTGQSPLPASVRVPSPTSSPAWVAEVRVEGSQGGDEDAIDVALRKALCATSDDGDTSPREGLSVAAWVEGQALRDALLCPRHACKSSPPGRPCAASPSRKRTRSLSTTLTGDSTYITAGATSATATAAPAPVFNGNPASGVRPRSDSSDCGDVHHEHLPGDLFSDPVTAAEDESPQKHVSMRCGLFPTPLLRAEAVPDAVLRSLLSTTAATADAYVMHDGDVGDGEAAHEEEKEEEWCWWAGKTLALLRLQVDWRRLERQGWQAPPHVAPTWLDKTIDKVKRLMDCLHIQSVRERCRRGGHDRTDGGMRAEVDDDTFDSCERAVCDALARTLTDCVRETNGDDGDIGGALCDGALQSRMLRRVTEGLSCSTVHAAARDLVADVLTHVPCADAIATLDDPAWQRAILQAPRLPLACLDATASTDTATASMCGVTLPHATDSAPMAELADWVMASCTVPSVCAAAHDAPGHVGPKLTRWPTLQTLPHHRVGSFFRAALDLCVTQFTDGAERQSTSVPGTIPLADEPPSVATSDLSWREAVWLVVQSHKEDVSQILSLFPRGVALTSSDGDDPRVLPSTETALHVLHQFWDGVASEVRAIMSRQTNRAPCEDPCSSEADSGDDDDADAVSTTASSPSFSTTRTSSDDGEAASAEEKEGETALLMPPNAAASQSPGASPPRCAKTPHRFTGLAALCLYLRGPPRFSPRSSNGASEKSGPASAPTAGADTLWASPWVTHLLGLVTNGQAGLEAYANATAGQSSEGAACASSTLSGDAATTASATTTAASTTTPATSSHHRAPDRLPLLLFRYEQLAARQVASEAHTSCFDVAIATAYAAYAARWTAAMSWLEEAEAYAAR